MSTKNWITLFAVTIEFTEPWAIGGNAVLDDEMKLPVVMDPLAETPTPVLPGASIAGSLRAAAKATIGPEATENLLGYVTLGFEADGKTKTTIAQASRVEILGSKLLDNAEGMIGERVRTAISNRTGAAETNMLRNEHIVKQASFRIIFQVSGGTDELTMTDWFRVLEHWRPQLGRGRTCGLGRGKVNTIERVSVNLATERGLEWWLFDKPNFFDGCVDIGTVKGELESDTQQVMHEGDSSSISIAFQVCEPIHIGMAEEDQEGTIPLFRLFDVAMIPGSSWKGALRHRTQTILGAISDSETAKEVTELLYGSKDRGRGMLWFRNSTFFAADGVSPPQYAQREHVAIDRFTGGAKDAAKFTWECIPPGHRVTLEILTKNLAEDSELRNLVHHTLRDLHDGIIGIGAGISRGYGRLKAIEPGDIVVYPINVEKLQEELYELTVRTRGEQVNNMSRGTLRKIQAEQLSDIPTEKIVGWYWTDTDTAALFPGIHIEKSLPQHCPSFATHMWGWGDNRYIRIRVDNSLPNGFIATELLVGNENVPGEKCSVNTQQNIALGWELQSRIERATVMTVRRESDPTMSVEFIKLHFALH